MATAVAPSTAPTAAPVASSSGRRLSMQAHPPSPPAPTTAAATQQQQQHTNGDGHHHVGGTTDAMEFDDVPPACRACKKVLAEPEGDSVFVSFSDNYWHIECFRCVKCDRGLRDDANINILSHGALVCAACSYVCAGCSNPIENEAIVTGDDSYHAECFRCKTCRVHIAELIFAKTSQGIYCMGCHSDRVTRSRKLAEAKRNRSTRKEPRLRDRPAAVPEDVPMVPKLAAPPTRDLEPPPPTNETDPSLLNDGSGSISPSYPSGGSVVVASPLSVPSDDVAPNSADAAAISQAAIQETAPQPQTNGHHHVRRTSADVSSVTPPAPSTSRFRDRRANSVDVASTPPPPIVPPKDEPRSTHARLGSGLSDRVLPGLPLPKSATLRRNANEPRPSTADQTGGVRSISPLPRPYDSSPALNTVESLPPQQQLHRREQSKESGGSGEVVKPSGLAVTFDGRANRRSGFYGFQARPGAVDDNAIEPPRATTEPMANGGVGTGPASISEEGVPVDEKTDGPPVTPPVDVGVGGVEIGPAVVIGNGTERPMSFYDPDTLLFLDAVASPPRTASRPPGVPGGAFTIDPPPRESSRDVEALAGSGVSGETGDPHLTTVIGTADVVTSTSSKREKVEHEKAAEDLTRRVRQSIMQTKKKAASGEMNLDVTLVEKLLAELEGTKEKMKALQGQYTAMKRASRTAFEGFNMAREEYDREVAARHQAEAQMVSLKAEMAELASRLAASDTLKSLQTQSQQLRTSVDGLQRKLSVLQVERDIKVAEVEALQKLDTKSADAPSQVGAVPRSLSNRLEVIKQGYRAQIDELANERDAISREVEHLRKVRDAQAAEFEELNRRSDGLAAQNERSQRELEQTRSLVANMRARPVPVAQFQNRGLKGHLQQSPSISGAFGPEGDEAHADPHVASTRRFKWGKHAPSKSSTTAQRATASGGPTPMAAQGGPTTQAHRATPSSLDLNGHATKAHNFQPVSVLRPVRCDHCGDKLWGLAEVRCTSCGVYCHAKCAPTSLFGCAATQMAGVPEEGDGEASSMFGNDLVAQAKTENVSVPRIVTRCIEAVEHNGLSFEGIYRKTGAMSQVKAVQTCFDGRAPFDLTDMDRFNDISAVTSALKNYFRQLPNPLFTFELHEGFISASALPSDSAKVETFERLAHQLPPAHFRTLEALMRHLNRIHHASDENKMTPQNLGVVFGPTLLRSQNPQRQFSDMPGTAKVVEGFVEHTPTIFRRPQTASA